MARSNEAKTIGMANSNTLAKVANKIAEKSAKANRVLDLIKKECRHRALEMTPAGDVWGIAGRHP